MATPVEIRRVADIGSEPDWLHEELDGPVKGLKLLQGIYTGLGNDYDALQKQLNQIQSNADLTESGKRNAKAKLATPVLDKLAKRKSALEDARRHIEKKRHEALPDNDEDLTAADAVLMVAIWSELPRDNLKVMEVHANAIGEGDNLTARAIEQLPSFFKGAPNEADREQLTRKRVGAIADPVTNRYLEKAERAIGDVELRLTYFEHEFEGVEDDVAEVASGATAPDAS